MAAAAYLIVLAVFAAHIHAQEEEATCGDRMRRLREFYCVSNCIGLSSPETDDKSAMLAGRTRALNPGFNCSLQEFAGPKVGVCCQSFPILSISEAPVRAECVKRSTLKQAELEVVHNDYIFNKWQGEANTIELEKAVKVNNLDKLMQYMECIFLGETAQPKFKLMTADGKIDVEKTDAAFKASLPPTAPKPYMDLFNKIISNCTASVPLTFSSKPVIVAGKPVQAAPFLITQCIRKWIILECPNAGTTVSKPCQDTKTNVKNCDFYV